MPMTVQHFVHEPQDLPGTMDGLNAAFQSWFANVVAGAAVSARPAFLRFCLANPDAFNNWGVD